MVVTLIALVVVVIAAFNVKVVSTAGVDEAASGGFNAVSFADEHYSDVSDYIDKNAVDLAELLARACRRSG